MEEINTFTWLVIIVVGIFQLILFFKLWGMTNDVREIKEKYLKSDGVDTSNKQNEIKKQSKQQFQDRVLTWENKQDTL